MDRLKHGALIASTLLSAKLSEPCLTFPLSQGQTRFFFLTYYNFTCKAEALSESLTQLLNFSDLNVKEEDGFREYKDISPFT